MLCEPNNSVINHHCSIYLRQNRLAEVISTICKNAYDRIVIKYCVRPFIKPHIYVIATSNPSQKTKRKENNSFRLKPFAKTVYQDSFLISSLV